MKKIPDSSSCGICGDTHDLHRHHLDWDHSNNSPTNIVIICQRCHVVLHDIGHITIEELEAVRKKVMERDPERFKNMEAKAPYQFPLIP